MFLCALGNPNSKKRGGGEGRKAHVVRQGSYRLFVKS
jgi:hypothetical protein